MLCLVISSIERECSCIGCLPRRTFDPDEALPHLSANHICSQGNDFMFPIFREQRLLSRDAVSTNHVACFSYKYS